MSIGDHLADRDTGQMQAATARVRRSAEQLELESLESQAAELMLSGDLLWKDWGTCQRRLKSL